MTGVMFYSNGGPGPATKLLAVDAPDGSDDEAWLRAPAWKWQPLGGWTRNTYAQLDIQQLGEFFLIEDDEVPEIQQQMRDRAAQYA